MEAHDHNQQPPSSKRIALYTEVGGPKAPAAKITIESSGDGTAQLQIESEAADRGEQIRTMLELAAKDRTKPAPEASPEEIVDSFYAFAVETLEREGFRTADISAGDVRISFELDFISGKGLATHEMLHDFGSNLDDEVAQRVFTSISGAMAAIPEDLAGRLEQVVAGGNTGDVLAVLKAMETFGALVLQPSQHLLDALLSIDLAPLAPVDRKRTRELRLLAAHVLKSWIVAGREADALLKDHGDEYDADQKVDLEMQIANGAMEEGRSETALMIWRNLLRAPGYLQPGARGWVWSNIALASPKESADRRRAAKYSADAFLEAGDKEQASKSLMMMAHALLYEEPQQALDAIGGVIDLIEKNGLHNHVLLGAAHHTRGMQLLRMSRHAAALEDADRAAELLDGIMGAEDELISAYHLASIAAGSAGYADRAETLRQEAEALSEKVRSTHFQMARRVDKLFKNYDRDQAAQLLQDAEEAGNEEIRSAVAVVQATGDQTLSDMQRLSMLEGTLRRLDQRGAPEQLKQPVRAALASVLAGLGQFDRAEIWYDKILRADPFDMHARDALVHLLWKAGKWGDAAIVLNRQLELRGPAPGLLFALGRSLNEAGDLSGAVHALTHSIKLAENNLDLAKMASDLREDILANAGALKPVPTAQPADPIITRDELDKALDGFARFMSADKRMGFWERSGNDFAWIERPERQAQNFLHTFLKARFLDRIEIFEELDSGAGRLDLYLRLIGGLGVILELKMCGFGYSSNYAAAGETQVVHYMENRSSHLGYLVVFDARLDTNGVELLRGEGKFSIASKFVDMRPRVSKR